MYFVNSILKYIKINYKDRCRIKLKIKYKLVTSILLAILFSNILSITLVNAQQPINILEKSHYIWGTCESDDYEYDVLVSARKDHGNEILNYYILLKIKDKSSGVTTTYEPDDADEFYMNMNHGNTMFEVLGKPFIVKWTATGRTHVTVEKYERIYHDDWIMYTLLVENKKTEGSCTVFYDNDVAYGILGFAGYRIVERSVVPIKE